MSKNKIIRHSLLEAGLAFIYVTLIATFFRNGNKLFAAEDNIGMPMLMLLLLVFSVAFMGVTIFGRSILWYLDGEKKPAIQLLFYKLAFMFIIVLLVFLILVCFQ
jgi:hypothetical protein